jgi:hypothetical protein
MVLSSREREIRQARMGITTSARWRPAGARGGRGAREAGQQGYARAAGKVGVTRGEGRQQEVDGGDSGRAAARGKLCAGGRRGSRGAEGVQRKKKRGRRSGGPVCENQKL